MEKVRTRAPAPRASACSPAPAPPFALRLSLPAVPQVMTNDDQPDAPDAPDFPGLLNLDDDVDPSRQARTRPLRTHLCSLARALAACAEPEPAHRAARYAQKDHISSPVRTVHTAADRAERARPLR